MRGRAPPRCTWHLGVGDMADDWCSWPQGAIAPVIESFVRTTAKPQCLHRRTRQSHSAFIESFVGTRRSRECLDLTETLPGEVRPEHQFTGNVGSIWSQRYFLIVSGIEEGAPSASSRPSIARGPPAHTLGCTCIATYFGCAHVLCLVRVSYVCACSVRFGGVGHALPERTGVVCACACLQHLHIPTIYT